MNDIIKSHLTIISPLEFHEYLKEKLDEIYDLNVVIRQTAQKNTSDPFMVKEYIEQLDEKTDGIILIAPNRRSPSRILPASVICGVPCGIMQADKPEELNDWVNSVVNTSDYKGLSTWASLAMNKSFFLGWGERYYNYMKAVEPKVKSESWLADNTSRDDLCELLATGPALAVYIGHGRSRGWSGYRALRFNHIAEVPLKKPCGTVISFSCDTLKKENGRVPFGNNWVETGRACSFLGSVVSIGIPANDAFAEVIGKALAHGESETIGQLLVNADKTITANPEVVEARKGFNTYRLVGNPLQRLF